MIFLSKPLELANMPCPPGHLNFHFAPLAVSYKLLPWWNQFHFFSIKPNSTLQFSLEKLHTSRKLAAKLPLCSLFKSSWDACATLYDACDSSYVGFENCYKCLAEQLQMLQMCVSHHTLVEGGKNRTERCSYQQYKPKSLYQYRDSKGTNCIPKSHIVYIDTTGFLFMAQLHPPRVNLGKAHKTAP